MIKLFLLLIILLLTFFSKGVNGQSTLVLDYKGELTLTDTSPFFQSPLSEFKFDNGIIYITSNPSSLSAYSLSTGKQLFHNKFSGRGPFESENLYNVSLTDNSIILTDYSGKLIELDKKSRKGVNEHILKATRLKNVLKINDYFLITHESPSFKKYLLKYIQESNELFELYPDQNFENVMLSAFKSGGTLLQSDDYIILIKPFGKILYKLDLRTVAVIDSLELEIPNFESNKKNLANNAYFENPMLLQEFFEKNSLITGVYELTNTFAIETHYLNDGFKRGISIFDKNFNFLCSDIFDNEERYDGTREPKVRFTDGQYLFFYREEINRTERDSVDKVLTFFEPKCK